MVKLVTSVLFLYIYFDIIIHHLFKLYKLFKLYILDIGKSFKLVDQKTIKHNGTE